MNDPHVAELNPRSCPSHATYCAKDLYCVNSGPGSQRISPSLTCSAIVNSNSLLIQILVGPACPNRESEQDEPWSPSIDWCGSTDNKAMSARFEGSEDAIVRRHEIEAEDILDLIVGFAVLHLSNLVLHHRLHPRADVTLITAPSPRETVDKTWQQCRSFVQTKHRRTFVHSR